MKRILIISPKASSLIVFRLDMMLFFQKNGYDVFAVGPKDDQVSLILNERKIKYLEIFCKKNSINIFNDLKMFFSIKKILKKINPNKIFMYQAKPIIYGLLASKNKFETYPMIAGLGSIFRGKSFKKKFIKNIMKIQYKLSLKYATNILFQNKDDYNLLIEEKVIKKDKKVSFVNGSGVNMDKFKFSDLFPKKITFLFVGRLIKDKGVVEYLEACKILKKENIDCKCQIIGGFDTNPTAIKEEEIRYFIDNDYIEYLGFQKDIYPYLVNCSVFVLPSYHEGTPKSVLEAMSVGRPIITTNAPGCKETVLNNKNGFLVNIKDVEDLVKKMKLFINNKSLLRTMGKESYLICKEKYDVNLVNESIGKIMNI